MIIKNIMKIIVCMIILSPMLLASAHAATPLTNGMVNDYFKRCMQGVKKDGTMRPETQKPYCVCTALRMKTSMSQEDVAALSRNDRAALNKVLIDVNGPCMQYPVQDLIYSRCINSVKNQPACSCLSRKAGEYTKQEAQKKLPKLLADNPNLEDIMSPIINTPEFDRAQEQIAASCATNPNQK